MREISDECCDCATGMYPCRGSDCPNRHVLRVYCDECKDECDEVYVVDGKDLCENCLKAMFHVDWDNLRD